MNKYDNLLLHILLGFVVGMVLSMLIFGVECKAWEDSVQQRPFSNQSNTGFEFQQRNRADQQQVEQRRQINRQRQMEHDIRRLEQQQQEFERQLEYERNDIYSPY